MTSEHGHPSRIGWRLPAFYCPFDEQLIHPKADELEQRAVEWLDSFALYPDATERAWGLATRSADFTSRIIPYGDVELMLLFVEWNYWAFAVDDWQNAGSAASRSADIADHAVRLARTLEIPRPGMLPAGRHTAALEDLAARTRTALSPYQLRRFTEGTRDWLLGEGWQTSNSERGVMPSLNDFAAVRMSINGTGFTLAWCEAANGIHVPPDEMYAAPVRALTDAAGFIVGCDNDIFSYNKEDHQEPWEQNLINVVAQELDCTPAQALPAAVAIRDRAMTLFITLREQLARKAGKELGRYLVALGHWLAGNVQYHNVAPRYASPRNRHELPVDGASYGITWRDTPSDPSIEPLPVPALAWWWQQLED
ncbi:terpene synthase family protein [Streptomyces sp. NPDC051219]|uniref:terpene synthase family protein n=1 Tax=Streptomyces sp. NPDC051219 TaxID=3155283 RepID=UPI003435F861